MNRRKRNAKNYVRLKSLLTRSKGFLRSKLNLVEHKEPCLILLRNNRRGEFYEGVKENEFWFDHSCGEQRYITLDPSLMHSLDYGKFTFKCYVCHEDFPTPLPPNPVITAEQYNQGIEKTKFDSSNWRRKDLRGRGEMWWQILKGIGLVALAFGGVYILAGLFGIKMPFTEPKKVVTEYVVRNLSEIAKAGG